MDSTTKQMLETVGFGDRVRLVEERKCPVCREVVDVDGFKDDLSKAEFKISGMCQSCQDEYFG